MPMKGGRVIKVRSVTWTRLRAMIDRRVEQAADRGMRPWWGENELTPDRMISWLISHVENDRRRARAARQRARERMRAALLALVVTPEQILGVMEAE